VKKVPEPVVILHAGTVVFRASATRGRRKSSL
jgi:hypothetical protein